MPSPFPGMDPYLEHPARWPDVHQSFLTYARAALNALLPPNYVARLNVRIYFIPPERNVYPDMVFVERPSAPEPNASRPGGAAVAVATEPSYILKVLPEERREPFIEIRQCGEEGTVVTVLELLSPSNKTAGSDGRQLYLTKQREILEPDPLHRDRPAADR